ncbi:Rhs family protein [Vibrio quintilis]|uniref:Uncharacterized protein n=1 Tax=Vibrio quintilis TaxID=1117707 RepID=A0A1M7YZK2_9VIBR|nr:Rhs family protein [Vibrio quintilis]SHO58071.1 hypothetical protein VQ7734_03841 [Vibrio quintilis]
MSDVTTILDEKFDAIKTDFMGSITEYKKQSENWLYGWLLEMDQKVMVNGHEQSADVDDSSIRADLVNCPLDGKITLVHCFESEAYVPIGGTPFKIQPVKLIKHGQSKRYVNDGDPYEGTIGEDGTKVVQLDKNKYKGKLLRVYFYPDVTESDIKTLLASYDGTQQKLMDWLSAEWEEQKGEWDDFLRNPIDVGHEVEKFIENMGIALLSAWDEISDLFKLLANPTQLVETLKRYVNSEQLASVLEETKKKAAEMLNLLKDEARCFLLVKAAYCWLRMLSPVQIMNIVSVCLASLLVEVLMMMIIPGGKAVMKAIEQLRDAGSLAGAIS